MGWYYCSMCVCVCLWMLGRVVLIWLEITTTVLDCSDIFLPTHTFIYIIVWSRIIPEIKAVIFLFQWRITKKKYLKVLYFFSQWTTTRKIILVILILLHKNDHCAIRHHNETTYPYRNTHLCPSPYYIMGLMYFSIMNQICLWANIP